LRCRRRCRRIESGGFLGRPPRPAAHQLEGSNDLRVGLLPQRDRVRPRGRNARARSDVVQFLDLIDRPLVLVRGVVDPGSSPAWCRPGLHTNAGVSVPGHLGLCLAAGLSEAGERRARGAQRFHVSPFRSSTCRSRHLPRPKPVGHTSFLAVQASWTRCRQPGSPRTGCRCAIGAHWIRCRGLVLLLAGQATRLMDLLHPYQRPTSRRSPGERDRQRRPLGRIVGGGDLRGCRQIRWSRPDPLARVARAGAPTTTTSAWMASVHTARRIAGVVRAAPFAGVPARSRFLSHRLPASSTLLLSREAGITCARSCAISPRHRRARAPGCSPPHIHRAMGGSPPGQRIWLRGAELFPGAPRCRWMPRMRKPSGRTGRSRRARSSLLLGLRPGFRIAGARPRAARWCARGHAPRTQWRAGREPALRGAL